MDSDSVQDIHGHPVLVCADDGPLVVGESGALDLIGAAMGGGADWVALPVTRLAPEFFTLRTRLAGDIVQKFANYRVDLAVVGDVSAQVAASTALGDFVREANRGRHLWFVASLAELSDRLLDRAAGQHG